MARRVVTRRRRWLQVVVVVVFATVSLLPFEPEQVDATEFPFELWSSDGGAYASWSYDPVDLVVSGFVQDLSPNDGVCASFTVTGYSPSNGWARGTMLGFHCLTEPFYFTSGITAGFSSTVRGTVCNGPTTCSSPAPKDGCTNELPFRHYFTGGNSTEIAYLNKVTVCSDHAERRTRIINKSDVVWSVKVPRTVLVPLYVEASWTSEAFRAVRPDGGTSVLALPGETVELAVQHWTLRWTLEHALSGTWYPVDTIVDELIMAKAAGSKLLKANSKPLSAIALCANAIYGVARADFDGLTSDRLVDVINGVSEVAGTGASSLQCFNGIGAARRESGGAWPKVVGLPMLEDALEKASFVSKLSKTRTWVEILADNVLRVRK